MRMTRTILLNGSNRTTPSMAKTIPQRWWLIGEYDKQCKEDVVHQPVQAVMGVYASWGPSPIMAILKELFYLEALKKYNELRGF